MVAPGVFPRRSLHPAARQTLLRASITNRLLTPRLVTLAAIRGNGKKRGRRDRETDRSSSKETRGGRSFLTRALPRPRRPVSTIFAPLLLEEWPIVAIFTYIYIYIFDGFPQFDELTTREYSKYRRVCIQQEEEGGGVVKFLEMARACVHSVHSLLR